MLGFRKKIRTSSLANYCFHLGFADGKTLHLKGITNEGGNDKLRAAILSSDTGIEAVIYRLSSFGEFKFWASSKETQPYLEKYLRSAKDYTYPVELNRRVYEGIASDIPIRELRKSQLQVVYRLPDSVADLIMSDLKISPNPQSPKPPYNQPPTS